MKEAQIRKIFPYPGSFLTSQADGSRRNAYSPRHTKGTFHFSYPEPYFLQPSRLLTAKLPIQSPFPFSASIKYFYLALATFFTFISNVLLSL